MHSPQHQDQHLENLPLPAHHTRTSTGSSFATVTKSAGSSVPTIDTTNNVDVYTHYTQKPPKALIRPLFNRIWSAIIISTCTGGIYGMTTGIIAGIKDPIVNDYFPDATGKSWLTGTLTASILIGGWIGAIATVTALKKIGLMRCLILSGFICTLGAILLAVVPTFEALCVVRGFQGLAVGASAIIGPLYVSEVTVPRLRSKLGTVFQTSLCFFILVAEAINYGFNSNDNDTLDRSAWKIQFGLCVIPGVILMAVSPFVVLPPEENEREEHHNHNIERHHEHNQVNNPSPTLTADTTVDLPNTGAPITPQHAENEGSDTQANWGELFSVRHLSTLSSAVVLALINQLTGINAVIYYAPNIFADANVSNPLLLTLCVVGVWNFVAVLISLFAIDKFGRYNLMLGALSVVFLGELMLTLGYAFSSGSDIVPLAIIAVLLVIGGYESGPGPLFFLLATESFHPSVRHTALSLTNQGAWAFNILVTFTFPVLTDNIGSAATFLIFTCITAACFILFYFVVRPRTDANQTAKTIDNNSTHKAIENVNDNTGNEHSTGSNGSDSIELGRVTP